MAAESALALVVRGTDWSETSRIATLFTREFGKVRALAKGGRRLKSSFEFAFDLLAVCHVSFIRKAHGGLDLLTEARLAEQFPALRRDLRALYAGYYVAELLSDGTQDYDPHPMLFDAAITTLRGLGDPGLLDGPSPSSVAAAGKISGPASAAILDSVSTFELVWLKELGYSPRLDSCTGCGSAVPAPGVGRVSFSAAAGGVLCPRCEYGEADRRPLSLGGLSRLRDLTSAAEGDIGPVSDLGPVRAELRLVLGQMVGFVLGRRPRLLGYLEGR